MKGQGSKTLNKQFGMKEPPDKIMQKLNSVLKVGVQRSYSCHLLASKAAEQGNAEQIQIGMHAVGLASQKTT
jgi:hypothetical protein